MGVLKLATYRELADERNFLNRNAVGPKWDSIIDKDHSTSHLIGVIAEGTFANWLGLDVHQRHEPGGDGFVDFELSDGRKVDIKGTTRLNGNLLVPTAKPIVADVFVLVIVNLEKEKGTMVGWIDRNTVLAAETKDYGYAYSAVKFVSRSLLKPMNALIV